jgi:acetolactate synthase I/II/III large subunit
MDVADSPADAKNCAEAILLSLREHGVEFLFLNPGTDSAPLQEAMAALEARGAAGPRVITCSFESVALAAAHGFWQLTRRPQAVFVHVDVGTQNLGAMVHNVLRDRAGVVVLAGKTPYGLDAGSPGGRSNRIHWQQDVPDQAGIVRGYAKWAVELTRAEEAARVVGRAVQVAAGGKPGLAYLMLSRDVLMDPAGPAGGSAATTGTTGGAGGAVTTGGAGSAGSAGGAGTTGGAGSAGRAGRFARPVPPGIEPTVLAELARMLVAAQRPVIVTSRLGRTPQGVGSLATLAELAAIPVAGWPEAVNVPTAHPMRAGPTATPRLIAEADLIVVIDSDVPWIPRQVTPAPDATVVQIDADPVKADMPLWTYPVDVAVTADGAVAAAQLAEAVRGIGGISPALAAARRSWHAAVTSAQTEGSASRPDAGTGAPRVADVVTALNGLLLPQDVVVVEAVSNDGPVLDMLDRSEPGSLCTAGGPGLGFALGASVGAKLARPGDQVVALVGDGAFMFGVPTAALCLAAEAHAPFVAVVLNNNGYRASRLPVTALFPDGAAARGEVPGTRFIRPPDFAALARSCGAHGERVTSVADLPTALKQALKAASDGQPAVVDVAIAGQ